MSLEKFHEILETSGLPVAYYAFPEEEAPGLPFICYLVVDTNTFKADGETYVAFNHVLVELYTKQKDLAVEAKVEQALEGFAWNKTETFLDDEKCFEIIYELEV